MEYDYNPVVIGEWFKLEGNWAREFLDRNNCVCPLAFAAFIQHFPERPSKRFDVAIGKYPLQHENASESSFTRYLKLRSFDTLAEAKIYADETLREYVGLPMYNYPMMPKLNQMIPFIVNDPEF